jgi:spore coat polysaccharide biosynthesis protein SpsF
MNTDIFIPVRLDSSRLSKKHLKKINNVPIIELLVQRLKKVKNVRHIIVCTTNKESDDELVKFLVKKKILYFRGDDTDILKRFYDAAQKFQTEIIIDVEGDKLYTEPFFVSKIISEIENSNYDFVIGNDSIKKFNPSDHLIHGIIPAGIRVSSIKKVSKLKNEFNKETGYKEIFVNSKNIKKKFFVFNSKLEVPPSLRLTIDYPEDLNFARKLFSILKENFTHKDILKIVKNNPDLLKKIEKINKKWLKNYNHEMKNC